MSVRKNSYLNYINSEKYQSIYKNSLQPQQKDFIFGILLFNICKSIFKRGKNIYLRTILA